MGIPSVPPHWIINRGDRDGHQVQIMLKSNLIDQSIVFVIIVPRRNRWILMTRHNRHYTIENHRFGHAISILVPSFPLNVIFGRYIPI